MKNVLCKCSSFFVNLIEGAASMFAVAVIYAFLFEANNKEHDIGLGVIILLIWLLVLIIPSLLFICCGKFRIKDVVIFQCVPFILGVALFTVYQLVLL